MASLSLEEYRRKLGELAYLEEELDELRQRMDGRVTSSYAAVKAHSGDVRAVEARVLQLADTATRYNDLLDELAVLRLEAEEELKQVPDNARDILARVYIDGWTVTRTAKDLNYNYRTVEKLKKQALQQLRERMMNDDKRSDQKET